MLQPQKKMAASSVSVRSPWIDEFIRVITSPVDAVNVKIVKASLQAVCKKRPQTLEGRSNSRRAFLEQTGATKVLTFLQTDCHEWSKESTILLKEARNHVYMILLHLTCAGDVKNEVRESLVTGGVCDEVSRDVCQNMTEASTDKVHINHDTLKAKY